MRRCRLTLDADDFGQLRRVFEYFPEHRLCRCLFFHRTHHRCSPSIGETIKPHRHHSRPWSRVFPGVLPGADKGGVLGQGVAVDFSTDKWLGPQTTKPDSPKQYSTPGNLVLVQQLSAHPCSQCQAILQSVQSVIS